MSRPGPLRLLLDSNVVTGVDDRFDQEATLSYRDLPDGARYVEGLRDKARGADTRAECMPRYHFSCYKASTRGHRAPDS